MKLAYCPIGNGAETAPFDRIFTSSVDASESLENVDAVVFWGGTDIHPSLYGQGLHLQSQARYSGPSERDKFEWKLMKWCKVNNVPMIGVCRGAQMMCAFAGGKLIQHIQGHGITHQIVTDTGELMNTTSAHHQMMYPWDVPHELLAWTPHKRSHSYEDGTGMDVKEAHNYPEPEIVYFPEINGLAIQGHPEWATSSRFADYCNELILSKLFSDITV